MNELNTPQKRAEYIAKRMNELNVPMSSYQPLTNKELWIESLKAATEFLCILGGAIFLALVVGGLVDLAMSYSTVGGVFLLVIFCFFFLVCLFRSAFNR
jgi:hypothetical protein